MLSNAVHQWKPSTIRIEWSIIYSGPHKTTKKGDIYTGTIKIGNYNIFGEGYQIHNCEAKHEDIKKLMSKEAYLMPDGIYYRKKRVMRFKSFMEDAKRIEFHYMPSYNWRNPFY